MKRTIALLLALCLLLCGCQGNVEETQPTTESTAAPTTEPTTAPTTEPTTAPTEPVTEPTEPPLLYQHPITGEMLAEPMLNRPVAVVINNISQAQPLHGISQADVLYEITAEGGGTITRCLAIFTQLEDVEVIGSIRSARTYLIDLARAYRAPLVHCGGSEYALQELNSSRYASLNEFYYSKFFYRDAERISEGYSREHTLFAAGPDLMEALKTKGYEMLYEEERTYGQTFSQELTISGEPASEITLHFYENGKTTTMIYDEETGMYHGIQRWRSGLEYEMIDGNLERQVEKMDPQPENPEELLVPVPFRNVFILYAKTTTDGYRMFAELTGEGTGYYACGGQIVPILWKRDNLTDPFTYTLEDGTPLTLGVGKTYVGILPRKSPVEFQ